MLFRVSLAVAAFAITCITNGNHARAATQVTTLWSFTLGNDGGSPFDRLLAGKHGELYGTTFGGGTSGLGVVFQLTPPAAGHSQWTETVLHAFTGGSDGSYPKGGLIMDQRGVLYGTSSLVGGDIAKSA
jgi:uncharacterized repeat protein (TIGR03803 family)